MQPNLYVPPESIPVTRPDLPGPVAYLYTSRNGHPAAIGYNTNAKKHAAFNCYFSGTVQRAAYVQNWLTNLAAREAEKEAKRAEAKTWHHDLPGDILNGSWGYDQTNQEFYQVVGVNPTSNSVVIRKIGGHHIDGIDGFMCASVVPDKDSFRGPERRALVQQKGYKGTPRINICVEVGGKWHNDGYRVGLDKWDGKPSYSSWYA